MIFDRIFRFMVILRYGGVYADTEVECRRPLESLIRPTDTMVVGWDIEAPTNEMALAMGLLRRRQLHQMFFAAAPGHPALRDVCNHIAASTAQPLEPMNSNGTWINSPFRGIWTDVVLKHALMRQHLGKVR
jgi:mannosyltransferase OCH1-like enzyme